MKKSLIILTVVLGLFSCEKEYDTPPIDTLPEGSVITMDSLIQMFQGAKITIKEDLSVYATVTMDEVDGNIYKNIFMQDSTAAINVRMLAGGGLYEGDYVRIALRGTVLNSYNGVMQLDSVDADVNLIKQATGQSFPAQKLTIAEIKNLGVALQSKLVYIDSVQFYAKDLNLTYANAATQSDADRTLTDCSGNDVIVRSSGYANFAGEKLAQGRGSLYAIVGLFRDEVQLSIRSYEEMNMDDFDSRCDDGTHLALFGKDFQDNSITSDGWSSQNVTGISNWELDEWSGNFYLLIDNYDAGTKTAAETWYISPEMDLSAVTNPVCEFMSSTNFSGAAIEAYVVTSYTGDITTATKTQLSPTLSSGNWDWASSGAMDLSTYQSAPVRVAFKYTGTDTDGATWQLDDIVIREN